ncbi:MAG: thioredoxin family protein [Candidatus Marinimicrobia bacterium]|nr:thioredoxin family protein [Candidatus Neomarinimicrobiota bacterium]
MKAGLSVLLVWALGAAVALGAEVGAPAPSFTLPDTNGKTHSLSDFAGQIVVLEWINVDCPFVKKHYGAGNMQALQSRYGQQGVAWLAVCSSAPGKQGHYTAAEWKPLIESTRNQATAVLLDPAGEVGRLYDAKTTPHMYVIDGEGTLVYAGAIDSNRSHDPATIADAENYVAAVVDALLAGEPVPHSQTKPYGCSVKY